MAFCELLLGQLEQTPPINRLSLDDPSILVYRYSSVLAQVQT
jgi:hypothetical protein